jgi:hypothetical protein
MRHPIQSPNYMGSLMEIYTSLTLFYTKISFKILKFSNRPSCISLFLEQSTLRGTGGAWRGVFAVNAFVFARRS